MCLLGGLFGEESLRCLGDGCGCIEAMGVAVEEIGGNRFDEEQFAEGFKGILLVPCLKSFVIKNGNLKFWKNVSYLTHFQGTRKFESRISNLETNSNEQNTNHQNGRTPTPVLF